MRHHAWRAASAERACRVQRFNQSKVNQSELTVAVEADVLRLDVAVGDAGVVAPLDSQEEVAMFNQLPLRCMQANRPHDCPSFVLRHAPRRIGDAVPKGAIRQELDPYDRVRAQGSVNIAGLVDVREWVDRPVEVELDLVLY